MQEEDGGSLSICLEFVCLSPLLAWGHHSITDPRCYSAVCVLRCRHEMWGLGFGLPGRLACRSSESDSLCAVTHYALTVFAWTHRYNLRWGRLKQRRQDGDAEIQRERKRAPVSPGQMFLKRYAHAAKRYLSNLESVHRWELVRLITPAVIVKDMPLKRANW